MKLENLLIEAAKIKGQSVAVASAEDEEVIEAVAEAINRDLAHFMLFGQKDEIELLLDKKGIKKEMVQIIQSRSQQQAAELAVRAVHQNEASVLMKGHIPTSILLKAVLNKEYGLRTGRVLSHVAMFDIPGFSKAVFVTDAAMNIEPDLQQKEQIVVNAINVARSIGVSVPKVAAIAAVEVVNSSMKATLDAAALTMMYKRGQIQNCVIDGPLALDNAVSLLAAQHKGITSDVAGQVDILLVPSIEAGNVLYKSLIYFAKAKVGAVIAGAKAPIVLTSRSDSSESKLYSLALALCSSEK
ncbi:phosphate butyryltransferase [Metabacillus halosaccharovorans]|uniref:Phosphate butyryltransferase n=1 Tax=Metabacillus halosaccharovorans TaxID=930124 RepID=A0ABT3DMB6_9BACI|nr:phosphate butyryltransferase [Metabacillus halosaccharovorans]MCV9888210.1 phosphate butyryltransferase [Metabacillus halosaccharovorans]